MQNSGCIIVDSTRRGKQYPDSFNATIPLWCGVINLVVFGSASGIAKREDDTSDGEGKTNKKGTCRNPDDFIGPPWMPPSQHTSIQEVIYEVVTHMPVYLKEHIRSSLVDSLLKPLQPVWVTPVEGMLEVQGEESSCESLLSSSSHTCWFTPVVLLSVSEERSESEHRAEGFSWFYVKGAGDDQENWCRGLMPSEFWTHEEELLATDDPGCVDEEADKVVAKRRQRWSAEVSECFLFVCRSLIYNNSRARRVSNSTPSLSFDAIISVGIGRGEAVDMTVEDWARSVVGTDRVLTVEVNRGRGSGQSAWQEIFSTCLLFYVDIVKMIKTDNNFSGISTPPKILVFSNSAACDDAQIAITAALLICFFRHDCISLLEPQEMERRLHGLTKVDVQIWVGLAQSTTGQCSVLSRSLLKELCAFFVSSGGAKMGKSEICGHRSDTNEDALSIRLAVVKRYQEI